MPAGCATFGKILILKNKTALYHSVFWIGIYLLWVLAFHSYSVSLTKTMTIEFCYLIFIAADYYAISNFVIPQFLVKRKYALFIAFTILLIVFSAWLRALVAVQMNLHFFHTAQVNDFATLYLNSAVNISVWVLLVTTIKMVLDRIKNQQQLELLEKEKTKSELDFLKAQINPHALFNSLNTIYGSIDKSNQVARNILLRFSELLRYQLYDCAAEKAMLGKEIDYIKSYVAFQQLRKNENLVVNLEIENINGELIIAPLLLIVLIENAFKFVSASSGKENKISIRLFTKKTVLHGSIFNTTEQQSPVPDTNSNGIGLANLKRRLELLYLGKYELTSRNEKDFYETNFNIDLA
jgi:two-component system LytT family sensor kinase